MSNAVKGTTRVSNNDRKLMKDLWVAGKDNPVEKNRLKRKLTQTEKATRQSMPEERAEAAFKNLRKKQKVFVARVEAQENDDLLALQCIQNPTWSDFCRRQTALCIDNNTVSDFDSALKARKKKKSSNSADYYTIVARWLAPAANSIFAAARPARSGSGANGNFALPQTFRFLGDVRSKRFQNFRAKADANQVKQATLVTDAMLARLNLHFFTFCKVGMSAVPAFQYQFTGQTAQNDCQQRLASGSDFGDNIALRLDRCRSSGALMHLLPRAAPSSSLVEEKPLEPSLSSTTLAFGSQKCVELLFTNGYDAVRQPRIMLRCDYCCKLVSTDRVIPQTNRLFFHDQCMCTAAPLKSKEFKFALFSAKTNE